MAAPIRRHTGKAGAQGGVRVVQTHQSVGGHTKHQTAKTNPQRGGRKALSVSLQKHTGSVFSQAPPPRPHISAALLSGVSQRTRDPGLQAAAALQGGPPAAVRGDRLRVLQPRWGHRTASSKRSLHICFNLFFFFFYFFLGEF